MRCSKTLQRKKDIARDSYVYLYGLFQVTCFLDPPGRFKEQIIKTALIKNKPVEISLLI